MSRRQKKSQKKKSQDIERFLKTPCEDLDKEISEWVWGNQRQNLNPHQSTKSVFLPPPADKPTPYGGCRSAFLIFEREATGLPLSIFE
jgi:hypothetical protein